VLGWRPAQTPVDSNCPPLSTNQATVNNMPRPYKLTIIPKIHDDNNVHKKRLR